MKTVARNSTHPQPFNYELYDVYLNRARTERADFMARLVRQVPGLVKRALGRRGGRGPLAGINA